MDDDGVNIEGIVFGTKLDMLFVFGEEVGKTYEGLRIVDKGNVLTSFFKMANGGEEATRGCRTNFVASVSDAFENGRASFSSGVYMGGLLGGVNGMKCDDTTLGLEPLWKGKSYEDAPLGLKNPSSNASIAMFRSSKLNSHSILKVPWKLKTPIGVSKLSNNDSERLISILEDG